MANNVIKRIWNQNKMVSIEALQGMAFQAEDGGHTFEISGVDDQGNPVALSGTVAGIFRRPDNADIALTGTVSDGVVSVTLTDACYTVPGKFGLTIYTTADSKKTAVYAAIGTVASTSGGAVAGDTPQDVVDLINAIEAAVAAIPASYTDLMAAIVDFGSYLTGVSGWEIGTFTSDGQLLADSTAIRSTSFYLAKAGDTVISSSSEIGFRVYMYTYADTGLPTTGFIGRSDFIRSGEYVIPSECYIRITASTYPASTVSTENDIKNIVRCVYFYDVNSKLNDVSNRTNSNTEEIAEGSIDLFDSNSLEWEFGSITSTGNLITSTKRIRSKRLYVKKGSRMSVNNDTVKYAAYLYSGYSPSASNCLYGRSFSVNRDYLIIPQDGYLLIVLSYVNDSVLEDYTIKQYLDADIYVPHTEELAVSSPPMKQYYDLSGSTFNTNNNIVIATSSTRYRGARYECSPGDEFFLTGTGGSSPRLYGFVDSSGNILEKADASVTREDLFVTAPTGSKYLIFNSNTETASIKKVVSKYEDKRNQKKIERLVPVTIINASFYHLNYSDPAMHYENGCRAFGFYVEDGKTYKVKLTNATAYRIGFVADKITLNSYGTGDIYLQGVSDSLTSPLTFTVQGFKTCFIYGSANTVTADVEITVLEVGNATDELDAVMTDSANAYCDTLWPDLIGTPEFYLSEPTASEEVSLNAKTIAELYELYDDLCEQYPKMIKRAQDIGTDASGTYAIREYIMTFANPLITDGEVSLSGDIDLETITNLWKPKFNNKILAVTSGMHGNEKSPAWGLALAISEILSSNDQFAQFIKSNFEVHIIPCINPYGFQNNTRANSNDVDINRDFLNYIDNTGTSPQAETSAFGDWLTAIADECVAYIDVHGTSGYYAYFEAGGDDPFYEGYCNACLRFTTAIQSNWKQFYADHNLAKYPYCFMVRSTYAGTKTALTNKLGLLGHTVETPQNFTHGDAGNDQYYVKWGNDLQACKLTKDLVINTMQMYGAWGTRVMNYRRNPLDIT